jgi:hypothetical protein
MPFCPDSPWHKIWADQRGSNAGEFAAMAFRGRSPAHREIAGCAATLQEYAVLKKALADSLSCTEASGFPVCRETALEEVGFLIAPHLQAPQGRPQPLHAAEFGRNLREILVGHVRLDGAHLAVTITRLGKRCSSVVGK